MPEDQPAVTPATPTGPVVTPPATPAQPDPLSRVEALTSERDSARTELAALKTRLAAQEAQMSDQNTAEATAQLKAAQDRAAALESENASLKLTQSLAGQVSNPAAAARLVDADLKREDGTVDTAKFLERYPEFTPPSAAATTPAATAPNGGGGPQGGGTAPDMDAAVRSGDPAQINAAFDAVLRK